MKKLLTTLSFLTLATTAGNLTNFLNSTIQKIILQLTIFKIKLNKIQFTLMKMEKNKQLMHMIYYL